MYNKSSTVTCSTCGGAGRLYSDGSHTSSTCDSCGGRGYVTIESRSEVHKRDFRDKLVDSTEKEDKG